MTEWVLVSEAQQRLQEQEAAEAAAGATDGAAAGSAVGVANGWQVVLCGGGMARPGGEQAALGLALRELSWWTSASPRALRARLSVSP